MWRIIFLSCFHQIFMIPFPRNFHLTDSASNDSLYHECLHMSVAFDEVDDSGQMIPFCLTKSSFSNEIHHIFNDQPYFTFHQLAQQQITSRQLLLWSAPMDVVENYQHYLDEKYLTERHLNGDDFFYNCTWPQFGSRCQYVFDHLTSESVTPSSLAELVREFYTNYPYEPITLTCYEHLKCNRSPPSSCLDWTEICDGQIDCIDTGEDEEHCWKLEINECLEDEYRCFSGQCIPKAFAHEEIQPPDCLDASDELYYAASALVTCSTRGPTFACEDITCKVDSHIDDHLLTSSCISQRKTILTKMLFAIQPKGLSDECWLSLVCVVQRPQMINIECYDYCKKLSCDKRVVQYCPETLLFVPSVPFLFGSIFFAYTRNGFNHTTSKWLYPPEFICFSADFVSVIPADNNSFQFNNLSCHHPENIQIEFFNAGILSWGERYVKALSNRYSHFFTMQMINYDHCERSNLYRCINSSKCIAYHHLLNRVIDCINGDDEDLNMIRQSMELDGNDKFFKCVFSNLYISVRLLRNGICDCREESLNTCSDENPDIIYSLTHISFQTLCDGFTELLPTTIEGRSMTDETDCQYWQCNNLYTRCDNIWNCLDGRDEINCTQSSLMACSSDENLCVSLDGSGFICLSLNRFNDGHIDCLGAADEVTLCRTDGIDNKMDNFYCIIGTEESCLASGQLCNEKQDCLHNEDENICHLDDVDQIVSNRLYCDESSNYNLTLTQQHVCRYISPKDKRFMVYFTLIRQKRIDEESSSIAIPPSETSFRSDLYRKVYESPCHRGLPLRLSYYPQDNYSQTKNQTKIICLCPPSFYGHFCQYQNQRIALTLKFRALSDSWQTLFAVAIFLVHRDPLTQHTHVHSVRQLTYLPMRDCQLKFHQYLLYATRPFNTSFNYSIHIHIYDKITFAHRSTWHIPVLFSFLPVNRLTLLLDIPSSANESVCAKIKCGSHSRCIPLTHRRESSTADEKWFCQCDRGWFGRYCTDAHNSSCSLDSLHLGVLIDRRSICLCSENKFGDRCLIPNDICQHTMKDNQTNCLNGGRCIPNDDNYLQDTGKAKLSFTCICPRGFTGDRCQIRETQLIFSFDASSLNMPESMLIHFIRYYSDRRHENATTIKAIPVNHDTITVHWSQPFHLAFIELHRHQYYLAIMEKTLTLVNTTIRKRLTSSDRCPHISELFNHTILNYHPLRRIKYYHLLCQPSPATSSSSSLLSCFYDQDHLCVCDWFEGRERHANCLEFNHEMKMDCMGQSGCENGARCFQDHPTCPRASMCVCAKCFYGRRCQFSMTRFSLSLDGILGYYIRPKISFSHQSSIVQAALILTVLMSGIGLLNGICTSITFKNKKVLEVGSGFYLLGSSITTLCTMVLFLLKFFFFYAAQTGSIRYKFFLHVECIMMDFILRTCLNVDQWLNACLALERSITVLQGLNFEKAKSRRTAKWVIVFVLVMASMSVVYDPMHRRLIEDDYNEEKRIWCITTYPSWLRSLDSVINMCHFFIPFIVNMISPLIIIWVKSRRRSTTRTDTAFEIILKAQFKEYKHLLITPLLIVIVGIPRLVFTAFSTCGQSHLRSWLYLTGYLVSFLPAMLTFVLFVLPSKFYVTEFQTSIRIYIERLESRVAWND